MEFNDLWKKYSKSSWNFDGSASDNILNYAEAKRLYSEVIQQTVNGKQVEMPNVKQTLKEIVFRVNDIYLCNFGESICKLRIIEICENMIRHNYKWEPVDEFRKRIKAMYGRRERVLWIFWKTVRV